MSVWVVIPTYNEAENVERIVSAVHDVLRTSERVPFRILIVDDASPDGTGEIADALAERNREVEVLHRAGKEGLGPAYIAGFDRALRGGADFVIEMDADLSHDPADLPRLLAAAREGADIVLGSRYVEGGETREWGIVRRAISRAGCAYARVMLGTDIRDLTGGFKCFRASALLALDPQTIRTHGYGFQIEATYRALRLGLDVVEIPIVFTDRQAGQSKMSAKIAFEAAFQVIALLVTRPHSEQPERAQLGF
jgi:dolichol-phosphate mannosyltransferase